MQLESQVISLDQAKRLKELGVNAPSLFYYYQLIVNGETTYPAIPLHNFRNGCFEENDSLSRAINGDSNNEFYPAYTVAEMLEIIPHSKEDSLLCIMPPNEGNEYLWTCLYLPLGTSITDYVEDDYTDGNTLAECLGEFLINITAASVNEAGKK